MKIGILIDRLNVGGVEKIAIEQVKALRERGEDARLVILREKAVVENAFPDLLVDVPIEYLDRRLPKIFRFSFRFPLFHFFSSFHLTYPLLLPFVVKNREFDYIISHGTYTSLSAVAFKQRRHISFSSFIWDPASYIMERVYGTGNPSILHKILTRAARSLDTYLIKNMDTVLAGGNAHNDFIHRINSKKNIEVIYPSVHPISSQQKKEGYVLVVTAWKRGKHPEYLLDIARALPDIRIKMVGKWVDPLYRSEFEELLKTKGATKQIEIVGEVSESELSSYYARALVLLQTNDDKGFGMPAIEAASQGTTFIIPQGQGVCDLFTNNKDGYYTKEKDTKKIVGLLSKLKKDKKLATDMGKRGLEKVKSNYSWQKHAEKLYDVIQSELGLNQKSIHVLFTGLVSPKMLSGGDQLFLDIAPRLPKDYKIVVITPHFAKDHWSALDQPNIEFRFLPRNRFEFIDNPLHIFCSYIVRSWQVGKILKKEKVQTIYSCSDIAYADIWPAYRVVRRNPNIKWISRIYHVLLPPKNRHGNYLVNVFAFRLQRLSFWMMKRKSSAVLALNQKLRDEVLPLGFPEEKLGILGAGIDFAKINQFKPKKKYPYDVVVLARVAPVKGVFDAVKIWKKVHDTLPNLKFAWVGGGGENYSKKLKKLLKENSLEDTFHPLGFVDNDVKYSVLKSGSLFLCTDHENGWGLAVCEAMAAGLPVVSYDIDIFGSVYNKGFKTVPLFNTNQFAEEIIKLFKDKHKREQMAADATEQARIFDHQQVINQLVTYLQ